MGAEANPNRMQEHKAGAYLVGAILGPPCLVTRIQVRPQLLVLLLVLLSLDNRITNKVSDI